MWALWMLAILGYLVLMYGSYKWLDVVTTQYLLNLSKFGNEAVMKYYERMHQIRFTKDHSSVMLMIFFVTISILCIIMWPVIFFVSAIWTYVDYKITLKEFSEK